MKILILLLTLSSLSFSATEFGEKITLKNAVSIEKALKSGTSKEPVKENGPLGRGSN